MTITLEQLRTQSRQRADMENSKFVSDSELTSYINNSIAELHDILAESYGSEYFVKNDTIDVSSGTSSYDLPTDFYELKGVDVKLDNQTYINMRPFNFNERNRFGDFSFWDLAGITNIRYRLVGNQLMVSPVPDRNATIRIWYVPVATKLVNDADTLDDFNAYSEYVIVDAAIKMMQKEESDVSVLAAQKMALEKRIRDKSQNRDAASPDSITDIYAENDDYYWKNGG
jgi:hypothetical protein